MFRGVIPFLCVGLGGMLGSLCRYGLSLLFREGFMAMPFGTLLSNVTGCLVIGAVMALAAVGEALTPPVRLFLATGFCGGFTTLSSLIYELMYMLRDGQWLYAGMYFVLTLAGSALAFVLGAFAIKALIRI